MNVELVYLDDCPHWREARTRLIEAMRRVGLDPACLHSRGVATERASVDFPGSPTVLVDGADPFPSDVAFGPTCRRYQTATGPDVAPSVPQLVEVLGGKR